jgi:hypothetical protein
MTIEQWWSCKWVSNMFIRHIISVVQKYDSFTGGHPEVNGLSLTNGALQSTRRALGMWVLLKIPWDKTRHYMPYIIWSTLYDPIWAYMVILYSHIWSYIDLEYGSASIICTCCICTKITPTLLKFGYGKIPNCWSKIWWDKYVTTNNM